MTLAASAVGKHHCARRGEPPGIGHLGDNREELSDLLRRQRHEAAVIEWRVDPTVGDGYSLNAASFEQADEDRQQRHTLAFDIDPHVKRKPPIPGIGDISLPFAPSFDGPCPELGGDFDLPAGVFERRQRSRNKLLPALGQVAAVE
jgi:hypothetical protein